MPSFIKDWLETLTKEQLKQADEWLLSMYSGDCEDEIRDYIHTIFLKRKEV